MNDRPNQTKLDELSKRIEAAKSAQGSSSSQQGAGTKAPAKDGSRMATEMVVGVIVGAWMGYQLDQWFGTKPWLMVVFLFLGFGGGVWNVYRTAIRTGQSAKSEEARK